MLRETSIGELQGQHLGQYEITELIGRGGMAVVYRARQTALDRYVAIKLLPPHFTHEDGFRMRFEQEARTVARLEHPNIVPIYDYGHADDIPFIVMPLITGGTLADWLRVPQPLERALAVVSRVLDALDYAHHQHVVHRDIKPSNILMGQGDWPLLTDFGIAKLLEPSAGLTGVGTTLGTPEFMSPEQCQGVTVDHRADLYAMGIMLFWVLTGRLPFQGATPVAVIVQHLQEGVPSPRAFNPELSPAWDEVIQRSLAKHPNDRYPNARAMEEAIQSAWRQAQGATRASQTTAPREFPTAAPAPPLAPSASYAPVPPVTAESRTTVFGSSRLTEAPTSMAGAVAATCPPVEHATSAWGPTIAPPSRPPGDAEPSAGENGRHQGFAGPPPAPAVPETQERARRMRQPKTPRSTRPRVDDGDGAFGRVTILSEGSAPAGFFEPGLGSQSMFFGDDGARYTKIQETLRFYRDHLDKEYQTLSHQAVTTYRLWIGCVAVGFATIIVAFMMMLTGRFAETGMSAVSTGIIYFIQHIFQQREDHYRELASIKNQHLEYGNQWLLVIQSIDAIQDPRVRKMRQSRLVEVLTDKLTQHSITEKKS